jgi:hypothetical protein
LASSRDDDNPGGSLAQPLLPAQLQLRWGLEHEADTDAFQEYVCDEDVLEFTEVPVWRV